MGKRGLEYVQRSNAGGKIRKIKRLKIPRVLGDREKCWRKKISGGKGGLEIQNSEI